MRRTSSSTASARRGDVGDLTRTRQSLLVAWLLDEML